MQVWSLWLRKKQTKPNPQGFFAPFHPGHSDLLGQVVVSKGCRSSQLQPPPVHGGAGGRCCTLEKLKGRWGRAEKPLEIHGKCLESRDLQVVSGLVLGFCCSEVVFKETLQIFKSWTLLWVFFPAVDHQLMQGDGTVLRTWHPIATFYLLQDFAVVHACGGQTNPHC